MTYSLCNLIEARPDELSQSFISFQSTRHRTHNCLLVQTNDPLAVLCTCCLVYQPSSSVSQVHLSAPTTLKCASLKIWPERSSLTYEKCGRTELPGIKFRRTFSFPTHMYICTCTYVHTLYPLKQGHSLRNDQLLLFPHTRDASLT